MSKNQAQQPPAANPLATNSAQPPGTAAFSSSSWGGTPGQPGAPPAYTFEDQDRARFASGAYGGKPAATTVTGQTLPQPVTGTTMPGILPGAPSPNGSPTGYTGPVPTGPRVQTGGLTPMEPTWGDDRTRMGGPYQTGGPTPSDPIVAPPIRPGVALPPQVWGDDRTRMQTGGLTPSNPVARQAPPPQVWGDPSTMGQPPQIGGQATPYGPTVGSIPTGNVPALVGGNALGTAMQDAQSAAYKNATGYLDPQWKSTQDALESKLANQGVMQNSEAWNKGMDDFGRQKEFAYSQARSGAVQQGNAAQAQLFNQGLAANANQFGQNMEGGKFTNAAQEQLARQGFTQQQIDNLEAQNRFNNSMGMRNQDINELLLQQQNPLNNLNALGGGQVQQPQFTNTPGSNMNPTDILAAIQQQYGGQLNAYNAQTGSANSANSGMAAIIAALLCDRRLKKNIRKIGMHKVGVALYEFDYLWGEHAVGVMADELEQVKPEAVFTLPNGFKAVDYARL